MDGEDRGQGVDHLPVEAKVRGGPAQHREIARPAVDVSVHGISSDGAGVARLPDGRAVFVHRTAPEDRVRIEVTRSSKRFARGRLLAVVEAGPDRRVAPCPHFQRCGGCTLQHLSYEAQLAAKGSMVTEALRRIGKRSDLPKLRVHRAANEFHYRNRLTFTLRRFDGEEVVAGFHDVERPERIVDVDDGCLLPEDPVLNAWKELRQSWGSGARLLPAGDELRLTLRATESGDVVLVVAGGEGRGESRALLTRVPGLSAIWEVSGPAGSSKAVLAAGSATVKEKWLEASFDLEPTVFLQVNRWVAGLLQQEVQRRMGDVQGLKVLDAYCGIAGYGRWAARHGARCVGIESEPGALRIARGLRGEGLTLLEGRVGERLPEVLPVDLAILNPPRSGVEEGVMEGLDASDTPRIIYVSCDPATLARDLARLGPAYSVESLEAFDLFPQTARIETVLSLTKLGPD